MSFTNRFLQIIDKYKIAIWILGIPISIFSWFAVPDVFWQYLFYLRVPILAGLFLIIFPAIAVFPLQALLRNLFVLRGKWQLAFTIIGTTISGMAVSVATIAILCNSSARFDMPTKIVIPEIGQYILAILLSLPICLTAISLSKEELTIKEQSKKWFKTWIGIGTLIGGLCSFGIIVAASFIRRIIVQTLEDNSSFKLFFIDFIEFVTKHHTAGYLDDREIAPTHIIGLAFLATGLIVYSSIFFLFQPRLKNEASNKSQNKTSDLSKGEAPALLYLMLIISNFTLLLGGITFYLDVYRLPILIPFILLSALSYYVFDIDHFFDIEKIEDNKQNKDNQQNTVENLENFSKVLEERLKNQENKERSLVIVCASGGGIQAAGWTVQVLTGLQRALGEDFAKAIGLISSVSGGSVGTMYYLDRFSDRGCPSSDEDNLNAIFNSSTADSLDAIGWGLAYPDLWRITPFSFLLNFLSKKPFLKQEISDRGIAIEIDWTSKMCKPKTTLKTWRELINQGEIPIPIFNTTLVEDGRR